MTDAVEELRAIAADIAKAGINGFGNQVADVAYAGIPGTGPADKQCRHCAHFSHGGSYRKSFPKCGANRARWTHGRGSDILAKAPACNKFSQPEGVAE